MIRKRSILLVDDDPDLLAGLDAVFDAAGFVTDTARDGAAALEKLDAGSYDVLLSDIKMPKLGGIELLHAVRRIRERLPVILITAYATVDLALKAMKAGANDFITKPFDIDHLVRVVEINTLKKRDYLARADLADNETRDRLYDLIVQQPGLTFTELQTDLALGNGNLSYHLHLLEKNDFIMKRTIRNQTRYFPVGVAPPSDPTFGLHEKAKFLYDQILEHPGVTTPELAERGGFSRTLAAYHLRTLMTEQLVTKQRAGNCVAYYPLERQTQPSRR